MASTKLIRGYLYNIAQQFDASCEHIRYLLLSSEASFFKADLLNGAVTPTQLSTSRNQNLVSIIKSTLDRNIGPILGDSIEQCELRLSFSDHKSIVNIELKSKTGKTWQASFVNDTPLALP